MKNLKKTHSLVQGFYLTAMAASVLLATACAKPDGHVPVTPSNQQRAEKPMKSFKGFTADPGLAASILGGTAESALTSGQGAAPSFSVLVKILYKKSDKENGVLMGYATNVPMKTNTTLTIPSDLNCSDVEAAARFQITIACEDVNCNRMSTMVVAKDSSVLPNLTGQELMATDPRMTGYHVTGMLFVRSTLLEQKRAQQAIRKGVQPGAQTVGQNNGQSNALNLNVQTVVGKSQMDLKWSAPWTGSGKSGMTTGFDEAVRNSAAANSAPVGSTCVITLEKALALGMPAGKPVPTPTPADGTPAAANAETAANGNAAPVVDSSGAPKTGAGEGVAIDGPTTTTAPQAPGAETPTSLATTPSAQPLAAPAPQGSTTSSANGVEIEQQ